MEKINIFPRTVVKKRERTLVETIEWRELPFDTPDEIWVSSDGRLYNKTRNHYYRDNVRKNGIVVVDIRVTKFPPEYPNNYISNQVMKLGGRYRTTINRLVAFTFLARPTKKHIAVWPIDGNPNNSHYRNLEWITRQEFIKRTAFRCTRSFINRKYDVRAAKIYEYIKTLISKKMYASYKSIGALFGVSEMTVSRIVRGTAYEGRYVIKFPEWWKPRLTTQ